SRPAGAVLPNSNNAALGRVTWENQTCRDEVLEGIRVRKEKIEKDIKGCPNAKPPDARLAGLNAAGRRRATECFRIQCKLRHQKRLLAIREEKEAKCFNDPALDNCPGDLKKTAELRKERVEHTSQMLKLRRGINQTKLDARAKCGPA